MQEVQTSISDEIEKEIEVEDITEGGVNLEPREETMATVQKKPMPSRDSQRAPRYRGKPKDLVEFFEEFEEHAAAAELSNGEKATWVVKYVKSKEVANFWKSLTDYTSNPRDYTKLKAAILAQYPGAETGECYTRKGLLELTAKYASKSMKMESRLIEYYGKFRPMGIWLEGKKIISAADKNDYFWYGIPRKTRKLILNWLTTLKPEHDNKKAPEMEEVLQAGRYILSEEAFDVTDDNPIANWIHSVLLKERRRRKRDVESLDEEESLEEESSSLEEESEEESSSLEEESEEESDSEDESERKWRKKKGKAKAKEKGRGREVVETRTMVVNEKVVDDIDELAKRLCGMDVQDTMYASTYAKLCLAAPAFKSFIPAPVWSGQQPATQQVTQPMLPQQPIASRRNMYYRNPPSPWLRSFDCYFCRGPNHGIRDCAIIGDYLAAGRITKDSNGHIVFANNEWIPTHPNGIKGAVDEHFQGPLQQQHSPSAAGMPTTATFGSSNFFQ
jgi:hypothetical protein